MAAPPDVDVPEPAPDLESLSSGKRAYATLITSDSFLMPVQTLATSLRATGTSYRLLVLHTPEVASEVLRRLERDPITDLREVQRLACHHKTGAPGWDSASFTKLRVWELCGFEKIVYIDADCVVLENVDELFERPSPAFAPDVFPPDKFNAGVMILRPSQDVFAEMEGLISTLPSHDGGDTGFLNSYFKEWYLWPAAHRLPFRYNALRTMYWFTHARPGYWETVKPIKILHFCSSPKPWDPDSRKGDMEQIWWQYYLKSQDHL